MTAADRIEAEAADLLLIAQAMCKGEALTGAAPCRCEGRTPMCAALDIYGDQAREVRAALWRGGRLNGEAVSLTFEQSDAADLDLASKIRALQRRGMITP